MEREIISTLCESDMTFMFYVAHGNHDANEEKFFFKGDMEVSLEIRAYKSNTQHDPAYSRRHRHGFISIWNSLTPNSNVETDDYEMDYHSILFNQHTCASIIPRSKN